MEIIFANPRVIYDSYLDYRRLVELSGIAQCYVDEIDFTKECIYITSPMNGEYPPHCDNHRDKEKKCKVIHWSLERPGSNNNMKGYVDRNKELLDKGYFDEVWISDRWVVREHNDPRIKFVIMGSDSRLCPNDAHAWKFFKKKKHDYIHLSYQTYRRSMIVDRFRVDYKLTEYSNCWPPERDDALRYSKFFINVHQDEVSMQEPLRMSLCAAYGLPYISEHCHDPYPMINNTHFFDVPYNQLVGFFVSAIKKHDYRQFMEVGKNMHNLFCNEHSFRDEVLKACQ